jgi:hypothetical protein
MEIKLENHTLVLVFLIIILIFIGFSGANGDSQTIKVIIALIIGAAGCYLFGIGMHKSSNNGGNSTREHMEEPREITNDAVSEDGQMLIDTDDRALSQFGNISTSGNVDTLFQRHTDLDMTDVKADDLDNSDIVQEAIQRGSSIFQPNTAQGTTASQAGYHSNFKLAQPGMYMEYSVPINPRGYSADEALARLQQHRAEINKKAIDGAVRSTRNVFEKYFVNELNENEDREWWSAEAQSFETDFRPYL